MFMLCDRIVFYVFIYKWINKCIIISFINIVIQTTIMWPRAGHTTAAGRLVYS